MRWEPPSTEHVHQRNVGLPIQNENEARLGPETKGGEWEEVPRPRPHPTGGLGERHDPRVEPRPKKNGYIVI